MENAVYSRNFYKNEEYINFEKKRKLVLTVIILLRNFQSDVVGLNFNEEHDAYVNVTNYDRTAQYYEEIEDSDYELLNY